MKYNTVVHKAKIVSLEKAMMFTSDMWTLTCDILHKHVHENTLYFKFFV